MKDQLTSEAFKALKGEKVAVTDCCGAQCTLTITSVEEDERWGDPNGPEGRRKPFTVTLSGAPHVSLHEGPITVKSLDEGKVEPLFEDIHLTVHGEVDKAAGDVVKPVFQVHFS